MKWINYNGVSFNADWAASKTFKAFAEHEAHHGFTESQLREVWKLCGGKDKKAPAAEQQVNEVAGE